MENCEAGERSLLKPTYRAGLTHIDEASECKTVGLQHDPISSAFDTFSELGYLITARAGLY